MGSRRAKFQSLERQTVISKPSRSVSEAKMANRFYMLGLSVVNSMCIGLFGGFLIRRENSEKPIVGLCSRAAPPCWSPDGSYKFLIALPLLLGEF
jgi:hypothetical protein